MPENIYRLESYVEFENLRKSVIMIYNLWKTTKTKNHLHIPVLHFVVAQAELQKILMRYETLIQRNFYMM